MFIIKRSAGALAARPERLFGCGPGRYILEIFGPYHGCVKKPATAPNRLQTPTEDSPPLEGRRGNGMELEELKEQIEKLELKFLEKLVAENRELLTEIQELRDQLRHACTEVYRYNDSQTDEVVKEWKAILNRTKKYTKK